MKKLAVAALLLLSSVAYAQKSYHLLHQFPVSGNGNWDYLAVCPVNNLLYISHETQVNIVDKTTGKSAGVIGNTTGVHGIAFVPAVNKGYITDGKLDEVTVFDIKTNKSIAKIKVGAKPDAIMYDDYSGNIYVCNGKSHNMSVIDPKTDKVTQTIDLGGKPETAVSGKNGKVYVNLEDKSEIAVIDLKTFTVKNRWNLGKGQAPSGLAIDLGTKRLFAGCDNKLLIILDAANGKVITQLPIGDGCDGVAFDSVLKNILSSNGDGTLTVIHEKTGNDFKVMQNVHTQLGARTIAVDEKTHQIYLPVADFTGQKMEGHHRNDIKPDTFHVLVYGF